MGSLEPLCLSVRGTQTLGDGFSRAGVQSRPLFPRWSPQMLYDTRIKTRSPGIYALALGDSLTDFKCKEQTQTRTHTHTDTQTLEKVNEVISVWPAETETTQRGEQDSWINNILPIDQKSSIPSYMDHHKHDTIVHVMIWNCTANDLQGFSVLMCVRTATLIDLWCKECLWCGVHV